MNNIAKFTLYFFIILLVTVIIGYTLGESRGLINLDEFSHIGSIIEGTIGVAVAFAGAYVAIKIAQLGTDIVKKEKSRDDYLQVNDILLEAIQPMKNMTRALNNILDTQQSFETQIKRFGQQIVILQKQNKSTIQILDTEFDKHYTEELIRNFESLSNSMIQLMDNPYAYFLWMDTTRNVQAEQLKTTETLQALRAYNQGGVYPSSNLIEISTSIAKRARNTHYYKIMGVEVLNSLIYTDQGFSNDIRKRFGNSGHLETVEKFLCARAFYEVGSNFWSQLREEEGIYANVGGAILHDIIISIPDTDSLIKSIEKLFSKFFDVDISSTPVIRLVQEMGVSFWMSNSLRNAREIYLEEPIRVVIRSEE